MTDVLVTAMQTVYVIAIVVTAPAAMAAGIAVGLLRPKRSLPLNAAIALTYIAAAMQQLVSLSAIARLGIDVLSPLGLLVRLMVCAGVVGTLVEVWRVRDGADWGRIAGPEKGGES